MRNMKPIIENGKVTNASELRRYWLDHHERECRIRRGMFTDLGELEPPPMPKTLFRPRPVDKEIDQLGSSLLHLTNKMNDHLDRSRKGNDSPF